LGRAHSAGRAAPAPDATRPTSVSFLGTGLR